MNFGNLEVFVWGDIVNVPGDIGDEAEADWLEQFRYFNVGYLSCTP